MYKICKHFLINNTTKLHSTNHSCYTDTSTRPLKEVKLHEIV